MHETRISSPIPLKCSFRKGGVRGFGWPPLFARAEGGWLTFPLWKVRACPHCGAPVNYMGHPTFSQAHRAYSWREGAEFGCRHCGRMLRCDMRTLELLKEKNPNLPVLVMEKPSWRHRWHRKAWCHGGQMHGIIGELREYANEYEEAEFAPRRKACLRTLLDFGRCSWSRSHRSWKDVRKTQWRRTKLI